ncbi:haloacid dehalogenase type II [Pseudomonas sp. SWRI18]|jgi:2-haloacid dehalogenase|uniref:haloacid dehalogenase type II n=1 Tax=Pseudomonas sp. SWRI18 TaxID=2753888 RepID=UPI0016468157|nr:haloacid dehalogenase type II [Pseudomonas sp. SWRI18]MBC3302445.1 haloacid dehalogenase type II [Pseudomonas sp. SWRI18]
MSLQGFAKPEWLTFDCYGTLIQWDEGLLDYVRELLRQKGITQREEEFLRIYDEYEHGLEQQPCFLRFRQVAEESLRSTLRDLEVSYEGGEANAFVERIGRMPPFAEVVPTLRWFKEQGFKLCIVSNTDDDIIAGNVAQLEGLIDRVITAQQAQAYKPNPRLFDYTHEQLGVERSQVLHICASPHLDLVAARDMGFHCIWIDRGTKRKPIPDYQPDAVFPKLDSVRSLFEQLGWARS